RPSPRACRDALTRPRRRPAPSLASEPRPARPAARTTYLESTDHGVGRSDAYPPRMPTTRERGYGGAWPRVRLSILARDRYRCRYCGGRANTVDHVVPISAGGPRLDPRNLVAACLPCNVRRARERERREGRGRRP